MNFFSRLVGLLTRRGRDNDLLLQGVEHAKAKRPAQAIEIYTRLLDIPSTSPTVRGQALFNRALAYSSIKEDDKAMKDLQAVIAMRDIPENVQVAARERLVRVNKRAE